MRAERITCDWNGCTESSAVVAGQPFDTVWLSLTITNLKTAQTTTYHLGPNHLAMLRDTSFRALGSLAPAV